MLQAPISRPHPLKPGRSYAGFRNLAVGAAPIARMQP